MGKVITFSNQKGGVGKTTTTASVAACVAQKGFRVLAIDLDPQGNLSFCLGADSSELCASIYNVLKGEIRIRQAIQRAPQTDIIASNILLSSIELEFTASGREYLLREALEPIRSQYDFIFIDSPPALSILTVNAFTATDFIVVPMLSDIFSLQGIAQLHDTVERVRKYCNPSLRYAGILLTRCAPRTLLADEIRGTAEMISKELDIPLFKTSIRSSISVCEAQSLQEDIFTYAPKNTATKDYKKFVDELLIKISGREGAVHGKASTPQ